VCICGIATLDFNADLLFSTVTIAVGRTDS